MRVYKGLADPGLKSGRVRGRAVAIGVFDGVHRAHRRIVLRAVAAARRRGLKAAVVTFDPHPKNVLYPDHRRPILQSLRHRLSQLAALGVAETIVVRFDKRFAAMSADAFLETLDRKLGARVVCVGHDFRYGRQGLGDPDRLKRWGASEGREIHVERVYRVGGTAVSSTRIREMIVSGDLAGAARLLGRRVSIYGDVVRGYGRGRRIGYATANLNPHHETLPPPGVYAAWGLLDRRRLRAVVHIGPRPTFGEQDPSIEAHFLTPPDGPLYGRPIELEFVRKLRDIKRFSSSVELAEAITGDVRRARAALAGQG